MPVSISIAQHSAKDWPQDRVQSDEDLFKASCQKESPSSRGIIQSSFTRGRLREEHISPSSNGLVYSAYKAYSDHHNLVMRPDDVWCAILTQVGFYINAHAEEVRHLFVAHEGQQELVAVDSGSLRSSNFGKLAIKMTELIQKNVLDPDLRSWVMPSFSTTTHTDLVVAAILMMGSMQKYFSYGSATECGIPKVTLLGMRQDWQKIMEKLPKLERLGTEPAQFAELLTPVLHRMVDSFDRPGSPEIVEFWSHMVDKRNMSGGSRLSGWITAFEFWNEDGEPLGYRRRGLVLDGVQYKTVKIADIPSGYASVPLTVNDNGEIYHTKMLAGSVGIRAMSSASLPNEVDEPNRETSEDQLHLDTIQPTIGWWMYEVDKPQGNCEPETQTLRDERDGTKGSTEAAPGMHSENAKPSERVPKLRMKLQGVEA